MNITRGAASGRGCGGGCWGRAGGEAEAAGETLAGVGDGAEARGGTGARGGARRRRVEGGSPQLPIPSLSSLLGVTKVQENYANEDNRLSQRGSLAGVYFLGICLRNHITLCPGHSSCGGGKCERKENQEKKVPQDFGQYLTCHPSPSTSKPILREL